MMSGWLDLWQQSHSASGAPMAWMGHDGPMPGMASDADIERLNTLPVADMEEQWLRLMIRHHRGAVPMADAAVEQVDSPEVAAFAEQMGAGQQSEIDLMQRLLAERGLSPEPRTSAAVPGSDHGEAGPPAPTQPSHDGH